MRTTDLRASEMAINRSLLDVAKSGVSMSVALSIILIVGMMAP